MNKIIEKIKEFFLKLKKDKKVLLVENTNSNNNENSLNEFKQSLDVKKEQKIADLQKKYEGAEISDKELSPFQVLDLLDLYKKQVNDLNVKISIKKEKLNKE